jgi:Zn-dependent protease
VHATFLLLLAWVMMSYLGAGAGLAGALSGGVFLLSVFGIVILHELGHAMAARHFGIPTRDITLWPIGGVARLERMPEQPVQELIVALAGPAVNVALALGLGALGLLGGILSPGVAMPSVLRHLLMVNVGLAAFNLLPAFPMDGGRVLRAILAMRTDYLDATRRAAKVGKGMAILFGLFGLLQGVPMLIFVALFVWGAGSSELAAAEFKQYWQRRFDPGASSRQGAWGGIKLGPARYQATDDEVIVDAAFEEWPRRHQGGRRMFRWLRI